MLPLNVLKKLGYSVVLLLVGAILLAACNNDDDDNAPPPTPTPELIDFGFAYGVVEGATSSNGVPLPVLSGDSLVVKIGYSGCSADHIFELRSRVLGSSRAELWLHKITPDEACQAFFSPEIIHRVPFSVLEKENIVLVGPDFANFTLR